MGKPHPIELRERVVAFVDEGHGHRETGGLLAKRQGNLGRAGKLNGLTAWVRTRLAERGDLTLDELCLELAQLHDLTVHRSSVGRWLHRLRLSHKKNSARQRTPSP